MLRCIRFRYYTCCKLPRFFYLLIKLCHPCFFPTNFFEKIRTSRFTIYTFFYFILDIIKSTLTFLNDFLSVKFVSFFDPVNVTRFDLIIWR